MSSGGDFKNNDLHRIRFDSDVSRPYYTRPMAPGLPDRVDCARLADDAAVLEREYALRELSRLQDLLADPGGSVRASFAFARTETGKAGATVEVQADPHLVCQRCLGGYPFTVAGRSEVEFAESDAEAAVDSQREKYVMDDGMVSLRDLATEELLLALPIVAVCDTPQTCGRNPVNAPVQQSGNASQGTGDRSRPFAGLKDLLKKT
jgi:uncharacterized protein